MNQAPSLHMNIHADGMMMQQSLGGGGGGGGGGGPSASSNAGVSFYLLCSYFGVLVSLFSSSELLRR